jgi:hypothetical protein
MSRIPYILTVCVLVGIALVSVRSESITTTTIKKGARASLVLGNNLGSKQSAVGDFFACALKEPLSVDGQIVLPARTQVLGHVASVTPWSPGQPSSEIRLVLDAFVLASGELSANMRISSIDERDKDKSAYPAHSSGQYRPGYSGGTTAGSRYGAPGRIASVSTDTGLGPPLPSSVLVHGDALGGAVTACNGDVVLRAGTLLRIRFDDALTVPLSGQAATGQE